MKKKLCGILLKLALLLFGAFAATFTIYMLNLENKLIYYVIRPFLSLPRLRSTRLYQDSRN